MWIESKMTVRVQRWSPSGMCFPFRSADIVVVAYALDQSPFDSIFWISFHVYCRTTLTVWSFCVGTMGRNAPVVFFLAWRFTCLDRWSLRINGFAHILHTNFFSPVCVRLCLDSSSDREKRRSQFSHLQQNGRSPVWMRWCALRCDDLK